MPPPKSNASKSTAGALHKKPHDPAPPSADTTGQQRTISDLFFTSKQGLSRSPGEVRTESPSKRMKREHVNGATLDIISIKPLHADKMYTFPSSRPKRDPALIDLTTSPTVSPTKNRINGARPSNLASHSGPRKLVVKNLKAVPRLDPDEYFAKVWIQLHASLLAIFSDKQPSYSNEELYRGVEFTCRQDRALELSQKLRQTCLDIILERSQGFSERTLPVDANVEILRASVDAWVTWNRQFDTLRSIFFYLDRSFLIHSSLIPNLQELGTTLFREYMFLELPFRPKILQGACNLVSEERSKGLSAENHDLLQKAIGMFHNLTVYNKYFEPDLLSESEQYFCSWSEQAIASNDLAAYVDMCDRLIAQESERSTKLGLEQTTSKALQTYMEEILISQKQDRLVATEDMGELLRTNNVDILRRLYSLLERRSLGEKIRQPFEAHIGKEGSEIVFDEARESEMVARLLDFKRRLDTLLEKAFQRHEALGHGLREAFESFINKSKRTNMSWGTDNPKPGEMIAKHVDAILKSGTKAARPSISNADAVVKNHDEEQAESSADENEEITRSLDQVLDLFRFVHGKAVFEAFYKRDLARRLLLGRSASSDAEKSMLTRLKSECGAGFTYNLEQMFKDIEMARDEVGSYKAMIEERGKRTPFDLSVNVLSASAWPSYPNVTVNVPEVVLKTIAEFELHYKQKHTGRKLEWKHALAHCQLKASLPKGNKEIVVSSFQAIVLLAFNDAEIMSYEDLQAVSGLDDTELKRTLQSLACAKYRVLRKTPPGKEVNPATDTFSVNPSFTHPKYRIKINQIQAKETKAENQATHERVAADRQFETQAAVVRIMKTRKTITHAELVVEVIKATKSRGTLDPQDIKKEIEKLIDKDYMEREEEGGNVYNYVA